ncbi:8922_t:CDS:1, partial [Paraglomus occultum]
MSEINTGYRETTMKQKLIYPTGRNMALKLCLILPMKLETGPRTSGTPELDFCGSHCQSNGDEEAWGEVFELVGEELRRGPVL